MKNTIKVKKRESAYDFDERYADLNRAFKAALASGDHTTQRKALTIAVNMPSCRFWVSPERLAEVISAIDNGDDWRVSPRSPRYEMYEELHRRYVAFKAEHPDMTKIDICYEVVYSPAPKFYMKPSWAEKILHKGRKKSKRERHHHLRHEG